MNTFLAFHFIMCHKLVRIFIFKTKAIYLLYKAVKDRMCNVRACTEKYSGTQGMRTGAGSGLRGVRG